MRVLLTGFEGFIGSHTLEALIGEGHEVFGADSGIGRNQANVEGIEGYTATFPGDIAHAEQIIAEVRPHAIIHLAAQPSLLTSWEQPLYDAEVNIIGTLKLAKAAKTYGVEKFVYASTSAVYNSGARSPWTEHTELFPERPYGISKLAAEFYVRTLAPNPVILRYGNVFGPRQVPVGDNQIVPRALAHFYNNEPFVIYGDGEQSRDFVYVTDIAAANVAALAYTGTGTFNVGYGMSSSVNFILDLIKKETGFSGRLKHVDAKPGEPTEVLLDSSRAKAFLHWKPQMSLYNGLRATVKWWEENKCPK